MNMLLPCRISVYSETETTKVDMIKPTALISQLSSAASLQVVAKEVEKVTIAMIQEAI